MTQVTVTIAGHTYRMACNEGEEAHLQRLAQSVDGKIERLKETFGEIGDQRITIMAAITVADELSEAQNKIARLEAELMNLKADASDILNSREAWVDTVADSLVDAAVRIEQIAQGLNGAPQG
jgi:cell division protein ZapA